MEREKIISAIRANPKSSRLWLELGRIMASEGDKPKARECYQRALTLQPTLEEARRELEGLDTPPSLPNWLQGAELKEYFPKPKSSYDVPQEPTRLTRASSTRKPLDQAATRLAKAPESKQPDASEVPPIASKTGPDKLDTGKKRPKLLLWGILGVVILITGASMLFLLMRTLRSEATTVVTTGTPVKETLAISTMPPTWTPIPPTETVEPTLTPIPTATLEPLPFLESDLAKKPLLEAEDLDSFKINFELNVVRESEVNNAFYQKIEGRFIESPEAYHLIFYTEPSTLQSNEVELIKIADQGYLNDGNGWSKIAVDELPNVDVLSVFVPELFAKLINDMEFLGREEINGRRTVHLRGDKDIVVQADSSKLLDARRAETAFMEIWLDEKVGFAVKSIGNLKGKGVFRNEATATVNVTLTMEYFDFNGDFTIEAPIAP